MKKKILILLFIIFIPSANSFSSITKYFGSSKLNLDETGIINFLRYLEGTFHAENIIFSRAAKLMSPMYYAVSEDGKIGYGWFCRSNYSTDCYDDFLAYKITEYCKEYTGKKCFIFAYRNEIVWNNLNTRVDDLDFLKNVKLFKELKLYDEKSSQKINKENYLYYIYMDKDTCSSDKNLLASSKLRGANLDCLLPGRYEQTINDIHGGSDYR
jgi:hypothetical protein